MSAMPATVFHCVIERGLMPLLRCAKQMWWFASLNIRGASSVMRILLGQRGQAYATRTLPQVVSPRYFVGGREARNVSRIGKDTSTHGERHHLSLSVTGGMHCTLRPSFTASYACTMHGPDQSRARMAYTQCNTSTATTFVRVFRDKCMSEHQKGSNFHTSIALSRPSPSTSSFLPVSKLCDLLWDVGCVTFNEQPEKGEILLM